MAIFQKHLENVLLDIGRENSIKIENIERFCKNSGHLRVFRSRSLAEEYSTPVGSSLRTFMSPSLSYLGSNLMENNEDAVFYLLLRAANRFRVLHGRYPGMLAESFESDSLAFEALLSAFIKEIGVDMDLKNQGSEL